MIRKDIADLLGEIGEGRYDCLIGIGGNEKKRILRGTYSKALDIRRRQGESLTDAQLHERMFSPSVANPGEAWELTNALEFDEGKESYSEELADLYYCAVRYSGNGGARLLKDICKIGKSLGFMEEQIMDLCLIKYIERIMLGVKNPVKEKKRIAAYLKYLEYDKEIVDEDEAIGCLENLMKRYMNISRSSTDPRTIVFY